MAEAGACTIEAIGDSGASGRARAEAAASPDRRPASSLGLRVTEDRVLIRADREDHAPTQAESGVYLATSMAAAVEGEDPGESWFVGTVVQVGPLVNRLNHRRAILRWLLELEAEGHDVAPVELMVLRQRVEDLPAEQPDPVCAGQRVVFSWASGQQIAADGERYLILRAGDVLAVLEDE